MAASIAAPPYSAKGPTVVISTSPASTSPRMLAGRLTSATATSKPPSPAASAASGSGCRPARTGRTPWETSASAVRRPVKPVAPKSTMRAVPAMPVSLPVVSVVIVTGTGTGVGKTVVTAALTALAIARGASVAVVKPAQTGLGPGQPGDLAEVRRLAVPPTAAVDLLEFVRYPDPLSPAAAARRVGRPPLDLGDALRRITAVAADRRLVLVEGAGGLLVRFDDDGHTLADLARGLRAPVLVVIRAGLGTLNDTALTLEALAHRGLELAGVVIGSWPVAPGLAERSNIADLATLASRPLCGAVPEGATRLPAPAFLATAEASLAPAFGGRFDPAGLRS